VVGVKFVKLNSIDTLNSTRGFSVATPLNWSISCLPLKSIPAYPGKKPGVTISESILKGHAKTPTLSSNRDAKSFDIALIGHARRSVTGAFGKSGTNQCVIVSRKFL
jgi:hypothetical protein